MTAANPKSKRASLLSQTESLATILREEFGVPFAFYDTTTGQAIGDTDSGDGKDSACRYEPAKVKQLAATRSAQVTAGARGGYQLLLPLSGLNTPCLVAVGFVTAFARSEMEMIQEKARLQKWAQSVCDRISLTATLPARHRQQLQKEESGTFAWEVLVTLEQLARRLRVHKDTVRHQKRILRVIAGLQRVEAMIWVPEQADADILMEGKFSLPPSALRQLAQRLRKIPDLENLGVFLANDLKGTTLGACFPQIRNLVACTVRDHGVNGVLIALLTAAQ
jgi:hypothetical protein